MPVDPRVERALHLGGRPLHALNERRGFGRPEDDSADDDQEKDEADPARQAPQEGEGEHNREDQGQPVAPAEQPLS